MLMASDTMPGTEYEPGNDVSLSLDCESNAEVDGLFAALSEGGKASMPPHEAFWNSYFAAFTDRFGIHWILNYEHAPKG
jgi:PhnB protein